MVSQWLFAALLEPKATCGSSDKKALDLSKSRHLADSARLAHALHCYLARGAGRKPVREEGEMNRKRQIQQSFSRVWISERDANRQLAWMFICSLSVLALTILSSLRA